MQFKNANFNTFRKAYVASVAASSTTRPTGNSGSPSEVIDYEEDDDYDEA